MGLDERVCLFEERLRRRTRPGLEPDQDVFRGLARARRGILQCCKLIKPCLVWRRNCKKIYLDTVWFDPLYFCQINCDVGVLIGYPQMEFYKITGL